MNMRKVTFNLPEDLLNYLRAQAEREHCTVTEVLWRSIDTERFLTRQEELGNKILFEDENRQLRHILRN